MRRGRPKVLDGELKTIAARVPINLLDKVEAKKGEQKISDLVRTLFAEYVDDDNSEIDDESAA